MAKDKWMQGAVPASHKGRFTEKAKRAHESVSAYASDVLKKGSHASTATKREAVLARTFNKYRPGDHTTIDHTPKTQIHHKD